MQTQAPGFRAYVLAAVAAVICLTSIGAAADPPSRVARIGYTAGPVTFSPAGEDVWTRASLNRPMTNGDRVWTDARARAEVQMGGAMLRLDAFTGVSILNLDDQIAQLQLTQGVLSINVRYLDPEQVFEVDTPNLAFVVRQPGQYRIEVDPDNDATNIVVRRGAGEAYGDQQSYLLDERQPYRFTGTSLRDAQFLAAPRPDEFENWAIGRDRSYDSSISARYVSADVIGYQDLDANGSWRSDPAYGNVWYPSRVPAGWAPYRDGHWAWIDPWGWTWVDDAPWGFAVSHYGRWANSRSGWCWVPGPYSARSPRATRVYYAPALVGFIGGSNFQVSVSSRNVGAVGWFPLGPREVYRPSYAVSRGYFENINRSNTVVNTTVINNYYNNTNVTNVVYANRAAVIAVPTAAFVQSQPVARAMVPVSREQHGNAPVAFTAPVAPTERSVRGTQPQGSAPPARSFQRPVIARNAPPPVAAAFAVQQQQLAAHPGMPLDDAARRQLRPAPSTPAPVVQVVSQPQKAPPTARPPGKAPGGKPTDGATGRATPEDRKLPPPVSPGTNLPQNAAPLAPGAGSPPPSLMPQQQAVDPRNRIEPRGRPEARIDPRASQVPVTPPVPPLQQQPATAPVQPVPPAARQPQPPTPANAQDTRDPRRSKGEPREPSVPATSQVPVQAGSSPAPVSPATDARTRQPQSPGQAPARGQPSQREAQPARDERVAPPIEPKVAPAARPVPQPTPRPQEESRQPPQRAPESAPRSVPQRPEVAPKPVPEQHQAQPPKPEQEKAREAKPQVKPEDNRSEKAKRDEESRKQKD